MINVPLPIADKINFDFNFSHVKHRSSFTLLPAALDDLALFVSEAVEVEYKVVNLFL